MTISDDFITGLRIFELVPGNNILLNANSPQFTILAASDSYLQVTGKAREDLINKALFDVFPLNTANPTGHDIMEASLHEVLKHKTPHQIALHRYDINFLDKGLEKKFWRINNIPYLDDNGHVAYIISTVEDITADVLLKQNEESLKPLQQSHNLYMQAPLAIQIYKGHDLIIELANDLTFQMWDRDKSVIGKPFLEVFPELIGHGYEIMMQEVIDSGVSKTFYETPIVLKKSGKDELGYYTFVYQPYYEEDKKNAVGVLVFTNEVTEQVLTKQKIKESELNLDLAIEIAELGIFKVDIKNNLGRYSKKVMEWYGLEYPEMDMLEILTRVHPDDREMLYKSYQESLSLEKEPRHITFRVIDPKTGILRYLKSIGQVDFENGVPVTMFGVVQNVTDQIISNKKLEESHQKTKSIIESAPYPMAVLLGEDYLIEIANKSVLEIWGKGDNVIGRRYFEIMPEAEELGLDEQLHKVYHTKEPFNIKNQFLFHYVNGERKEYYFNYNFTPLFDFNGQVYGIIITGADVTDLNIAKKRLEESSQNLKTIIMQAPVAMTILKESNHIIEIANDKQIELWGRGRSEVMNRPFFEAIPEAVGVGYEDVLMDVYTTGKIISAYELPIQVYRDGTVQTIYAHVVNQPYKGLDGKITGVMVVDIDVTDQVHARHKIEEIVAERTRQLAEANNALQQNNRELEQFAYVAAHDLQEPLRTISNFVGLFVKKYEIADPEAQTYVKFILNATARMQSLIKDLLDFSRTGRNSPFETVDLNMVLKDLLDEMDDTIKANNAIVNYTTLPVVNGIENELKRLFQNLISNAIKFKKENVPPVIDITMDEKESEYIFMVRDNGIGFEEKYKDKLFIIFQRLHTSNEYPGTGIGLAICKKIVSIHGGKIWVKSKPGKGSSFYFCIPKE